MTKENVPIEILDQELYILESLINGRPPKKIYTTESETKSQFTNPKFKGILHLKHIEQNLKGRYAYTPTRIAPTGTVPSYPDKPYPEVIPRFNLPKMPY